jgi:Alpha-lytic protease prodomain
MMQRDAPSRDAPDDPAVPRPSGWRRRDGTPGGAAMSPSLPSRPGGRLRLLVVSLLLALASLLLAPRLVTRSTARLERVKAALDAARTAPVGASWGVDVPSNTVLVSVPAGRGTAFVSKARSFGAAVRVQRSPAVQTQAF